MYPSFGYIGSKTKLLPFLTEHIELYTNLKLENIDSFGDLFSGSGVVSHHMMSRGVKHILSNDLQYYSYIVSSVINKTYLDIEMLKRTVEEVNNLVCQDPTDNDFIYKNYTPNNDCKRMFLTPENGLRVDRIRQHLSILQPNITKKEFNCLLKLLLYAVSKVSNTSSTYGAYLKEFKENTKKKLLLDVELINLLNDTAAVHEAHNLHVLDLDLPNLTVIYLDPPYNSRRYDKNYDFLETVAKYDSPKISHGITGLRTDTNINGGTFCSKVHTKSEFDNLFEFLATKASYLFMSYSSESILKKEEVIELMNKYWTDVVCYEQEYKRFKSNQKADQNKTVVEYLFAARKT